MGVLCIARQYRNRVETSRRWKDFRYSCDLQTGQLLHQRDRVLATICRRSPRFAYSANPNQPPLTLGPGYVVTGGQDAIINVFVLGSPSAEPAYSLVGHTGNICTLATSPDGTIVSGSWDA